MDAARTLYFAFWILFIQGVFLQSVYPPTDALHELKYNS